MPALQFSLFPAASASTLHVLTFNAFTLISALAFLQFAAAPTCLREKLSEPVQAKLAREGRTITRIFTVFASCGPAFLNVKSVECEAVMEIIKNYSQLWTKSLANFYNFHYKLRLNFRNSSQPCRPSPIPTPPLRSTVSMRCCWLLARSSSPFFSSPAPTGRPQTLVPNIR